MAASLILDRHYRLGALSTNSAALYYVNREIGKLASLLFLKFVYIS
jgi:hypothetical protein